MNFKFLLGFTVLSAGIIYAGFGSTYGTVKACSATVKTYMTAEYSETSVDINADGTVSPSTDYWSEPASEVYKIVTKNGQLKYSSYEFDERIQHAAYYPPIPKPDMSMKKDREFDNFKRHTDTGLLIAVGTLEPFDEPITVNPKCIASLGKIAGVKTWYGITYAADF